MTTINVNNKREFDLSKREFDLSKREFDLSKREFEDSRARNAVDMERFVLREQEFDKWMIGYSKHARKGVMPEASTAWHSGCEWQLRRDIEVCATIFRGSETNGENARTCADNLLRIA